LFDKKQRGVSQITHKKLPHYLKDIKLLHPRKTVAVNGRIDFRVVLEQLDFKHLLYENEEGNEVKYVKDIRFNHDKRNEDNPLGGENILIFLLDTFLLLILLLIPCTYLQLH